MIKIGCASYSYREYFKNGRIRYEDFIEEAYRLGLDGIELTLYWLPSNGSSYLRELKRLSLMRGLSISCAGIRSDFCGTSKFERDRNIEVVREGINAAYELGAPCLRVFGGDVPEGHAMAETRKWAVGSLKECANYAADRGVVIAMENSRRGITSTVDNLIKIIEEVNSSWLRVNLDLGNYLGSPYEEIAKTVPYAVHIHAKINVKGKWKIDYEEIKRILEADRYNGFLSIEYVEKEDAKTGVPKFARHLFNLFR